MAMELSRIDRKSRTYTLSATVLAEAAAIPPDLTGVDVALLPPKGRRSGPNAATVWYPAQYNSTDGTFTVLLAGPDADSAGALVVPGDCDIWMRISDTPEVDAELLERINVLGGGAALAAPIGQPVVSVNGKTGSAITLTSADVGADTAGAATAAQAAATLYASTGLAGKQDKSTLGADVAADTTVRAAFGSADPVLSDFTYDPATGNLLSYQEDGITITLTYNADGTVATSKRGTNAAKTYSYSGGNLVGIS